MEWRRAQERLESLRSGRALLSAAIAVLLAFMVIENMPASTLREAAEPAAAHVLAATGVDQHWSMFAPDPRTFSLRLEARIRFAGGGRTTWQPPRGGALVGQYWDYHWGKAAEHAAFDSGPDADALRQGIARFAAREEAAPGRVPTEVSLVSVQWRDAERSARRVYRLEFGALGP